jgi:hypothetical protein
VIVDHEVSKSQFNCTAASGFYLSDNNKFSSVQSRGFGSELAPVTATDIEQNKRAVRQGLQ